MNENQSIRCELFGVNLTPRDTDDQHIMIQLMTEDDGNWFNHGSSFSSYWIDDLIEALMKTKIELIDNYEKDPSGYGYILSKKEKSS
jgi:hypothetical protein